MTQASGSIRPIALVPCPACKHDVSEQAALCPHCGQPLAPVAGTAHHAGHIPIKSALLAFVGTVGAAVGISTVICANFARRPATDEIGTTDRPAAVALPAESERAAAAQRAIARHELILGMTAAEARQSRGDPSHVNRLTTTRGTTEQWVYRRPTGDGYLNFDAAGRLTSIQE